MRRILLLVIPVMLLAGVANAQKVEGVVKDSHDAPIVGATVIVKGSNIYAITDASGQFNFIPPKTFPFTIRITSTGFKPQDVQVFEALEEALEVTLADENVLSEVVVTARRRSETAQEVPISISVIGGDLVEDAGAFNVNRIKELVPTVQLYSSNPRNTTLNIRGLGSTYGLTNDGIDPGVGFYVDGVYYARPAATTLDFIDIEQVEVLRGPQGTLFGKNTTAGAFNVTTRGPSFTPGGTFELSYGNYGFIQAKSSITGPLGKKFAARVSFSGTQRDGLLYNVTTQQHVNNLNNLGWRAQLLFKPSENLKITLTGDDTRQHPNGYAQVFAGATPTLRAPYRQFERIITDLGYEPASRNPFDRKIDSDTPWRAGNELGGVSLNIDAKVGKGTLTSTSAWRYWNWDPSNDRDFLGVPALTLSQATSTHQQWSQEVRYAGELSKSLSFVAGVYALGQDLKSDPVQLEEVGPAQWRFLASENNANRWSTPGLLDGFGIRTTLSLKSLSTAAFTQFDWAITEKLHVLPGLRYNFDQKDVDYNRTAYGGLQTNDANLNNLKAQVYSDQAFTADADESNFSGQLTVRYQAVKNINTFVTYATSYKPVGVNLGGLPVDGTSGEALTNLAKIKPEHVQHIEVGVKTNPTPNSTVNLVVHNTNVTDYQTNVQVPDPALNRGYLANAEEVRVRGVELDGNVRIGKNFSFYGAVAYTDGEYVTFKNAPVPLEETGGTAFFKDISGGKLPGISKWAGSLGGELLSNPVKFLGQDTKVFFAFDTYYRSDFSSSPSPSLYLNINEYALLNARLGFRATDGLSFYVWGRNILDKDYFEQLLPGAGNAGHYAAVLGDPRTFGVTLRYSY